MPKRRISRRSLENTYFELPKIRKPSILRYKYSRPVWNWDSFEKRDQIPFSVTSNFLKRPTTDASILDENVRFDKKSSRKRSLIAHIRSEIAEEENADEMDTSSLQERVTNIVRKGKYKFISDWLDRLHFVIIPLYEVGNWLPLVMSRWYCSGHGCGLDQVAVENKEGDMIYTICSHFQLITLPYL